MTKAELPGLPDGERSYRFTVNLKFRVWRLEGGNTYVDLGIDEDDSDFAGKVQRMMNAGDLVFVHEGGPLPRMYRRIDGIFHPTEFAFEEVSSG